MKASTLRQALAPPPPARATALALALTATIYACSATSSTTDATARADADAGVVVLNDLGPAETQPDAKPKPDTAVACPNRCAKEFPTVPQCMEGIWDLTSCTCSLQPVEHGTPCDDGVECTTSDKCVAGVCEAGPPTELVEPSEGWQPEGTPLLQPDDPDWEWAAVHMDPSCRSCDGSRAYLNWLFSGSHNNSPYWAAATPTGELITLELLPRLRTYDSNLEPAWDAPATASAGDTMSRVIGVGVDGSLYAGGAKDFGSAVQSFSWLARYSAAGEILWERQMRQMFLVTDILPAPDLGLYLVEGGAKSHADFMASERSLSVRRLREDGTDLWATDIDDAWPLLNALFYIAPARLGGVVLAYLAEEMVPSTDGAKSERELIASAARIDGEGAIAWKTRVSAPGYSTHAGRLVALPHDKFMVIGVQWPTFGPRERYSVSAWLVDSDGTLLGETNVYPRLGHYFLALGATAAPDGAVLITGYLNDYHGTSATPLMINDAETWETDGFIMKLDRWGNFEWMRLFGDPGLGSDALWTVVASPDGRITATGLLDGETGTIVHNWIVRTDFWGRTCGMRLGVCADMPWQDCEDGNPCTVNWCDPDAGCTHPPLPDGSPCGEGLTCQGAVCK